MKNKVYIIIGIIAILTTSMGYVIVSNLLERTSRQSQATITPKQETVTTTQTQTPTTEETPNETPNPEQTPKIRLASMINGAGATFQYPQISEWSRRFQGAFGVSINYQSVGSGAGQRMFLKDHVVDFAASDPPLTKAQWEEYRGQVVQVPWIMGAVAVVYNLPGIGGGLNLTGEVIAKVYLGEIEYWNDPEIIALNPALVSALPQQPIIVTHRSDSSGTTEIFTTFLYKSAPSKWSRELVGKQVDWPVDKVGRGIGAKGNEGVTATVIQTPYSIGYVELSYALEHGLSIAAIKNPAGKFVYPTISSIQAAVLGVELPSSPLDDFSSVFVEVIYSNNPDAYPISSLAFAFFWVRYDSPEIAAAIVEFLKWIVREGYSYMVTGYVQPPNEVKELLLNAAAIIEEYSIGRK